MRLNAARVAQVAVFALATSLAACSSTTSAKTAGSTITQHISASAGGTVTDAANSATLTIPPGALSADIDVTLSTSSASSATVSSIYSYGPAGTALSTPATLSIQMPSGVTVPNGILVRIATMSGSQWSANEASGLSSGVVSGPISSLTQYAIVFFNAPVVDGGAPTPAPPPTTTPPPPNPNPTPTPTPGPTGWRSVVGLDGFFGQTFDDVTWSGRSVAPGALYSVACADNTHGWAAGAGGFVAHTTDGGATWAAQDSKLTGVLRAINFGWSNTGVVAGDAGELAVTSDAGAHWSAIAPLTNVALRGAAVAPYAHVMLVVGDGGTVLRSADSGATWSRAIVGGAGDFHGVASDAWAGTVLAVDSLGAIWSSADAGVTFRQEAMASAALDSVSTTEAGTRALAVGRGGVAMVRSPTGAWTAASTGNVNDLHAALVTDGGSRLYAAGEAGTLLTSTDLGAHWSVQPLPTKVALYGLQDL